MLRTSEAPPTAVDPAELARRIGAGDRQAEGLLVQTYQRPLLEILRHRTRDPELALDLLQDTLAIIIERLRGEGLENPEKLVPFMHRTAHNLVIAHFRKETRRRTQADTELVEIQSNQQAGELEELLKQEEGQLVRGLLDEMRTPRDREILLRFYVWEQDKLIVCQAMELSGDQFDRVVSRARQRFRGLAEQMLENHT